MPELTECSICGSVGTLEIVYRFEDAEHHVQGCSHCGVQTILPYPTFERLTEYYRHFHVTRSEPSQTRFLMEQSEPLFRHLWASAGLAESDARKLNFLELGFGNGASLLAAAKLGMPASGVDLDPDNVADVCKLATELGLPISCHQGDAKSAFAHGEKFDFVKASQLIEHLIDPADFLATIARHQDPGSYVYFECPNNAATFLAIKNKLRKPFDRTDFHNSLKITEHLWGFDRKSMTALLERKGYQILFCRDYYVRHDYFQPENLLFYPSLTLGLGRSFAEVTPYYLLKALIPVFDKAASHLFSGGIGLAALARKNP